jgi:hypothetical protein
VINLSLYATSEALDRALHPGTSIKAPGGGHRLSRFRTSEVRVVGMRLVINGQPADPNPRHFPGPFPRRIFPSCFGRTKRLDNPPSQFSFSSNKVKLREYIMLVNSS